jgi:diguanylate cyclase (GGDEF)-like protein
MARDAKKKPPAKGGIVVQLPGAPSAREAVPAVDAVDRVAVDASAPDVLDLRAEARDAAAADRDRAAEARLEDAVGDAPEVALAHMLARRDRAAAALDREEAALDRHRAAEYLRRAYRDELTGALQREAGRDHLARELARANRSGEGVVIAFLDVVGLKQVNDEHGHAAGDELLRGVGAALSDGLRPYDTVVRYGGDEFVCALPNVSVAAAVIRFEEVAALLATAFPGARVSIGLTAVETGESLDDAIARADRELYAGRKKPPALPTPDGG